MLLARAMRNGPFLMMISGLVFTAMVGFVKVARVELSAHEVILWRSVVAVPIAALLCRDGMRIRQRGLVGLRIALGFGAMSCFYTAAKGLPIADLNLIGKLQPLAIAVLAPLFLGMGERPTGSTWGVMAVGFLGCAFLLGPDLTGMGEGWALIALAATGFSTCAHLCLRALGERESSTAVVFWFHLVVALVTLGVVSWVEGGPPALPPSHLWPHLACIGIAATIGQISMTRAYAIERAAPVAAAGYISPIWAFLGDWMFFATIPSSTVLVGGVLIVGAGLALLRQTGR